ncbi:MAG: polyprenyl synthetase family protein, partial [Candidatus Thorarchaeota archaeon]
HDDLIDHDETRRGGKTFHAIYRDKLMKSSSEERSQDYGMSMAILGGDALINMGGAVISASELEPQTAVKCLDIYQTAFRCLVNGVLLEMEMVNVPVTTPEVYLEMVNLKTAILFEKSLVMGAIMAKATESQIDALSTFGTKVGQAFQMQDDILGSFGDESVTGKSADGDIHEGKKTMLLIQAQLLGNPEQKKKLDRLVGKPDMTKTEVDGVRALFRETGALTLTTKIMETLLHEGQAALGKSNPPLNSQHKEFLLALSTFLTKRTY